MKRFLIFQLCVSICLNLSAQNTFGTQYINDEVNDGYTLFSVHKKAYLIDNCGRVINEWESNYLPGNSVYLLPNGNILRAGRVQNVNTPINFGGRGGIVELFDWEGNVIWSYEYISSEYRQHHDVHPMPNGNVLILAASVVSNSEAIEAGRDPLKLDDGLLFNERIIEVEPQGNNGGNIVWEWNIMDHIIQDLNETKNNYGDVSLEPGKLDINYLNGLDSGSNWLHVNSIQYNEERDQIVLSSRRLCELWIIDHSTTTAEAATDTGGIYGKGGDFLYRWGNPEAYRQGNVNDRKLFGQHFPYIIETGFPNESKIIIFNNGNGRMPFYSQVDIIEPPVTSPGFYSYLANTAFEPTNTFYTFPETPPTEDADFFSNALSSAQQLSNGNILICEGTQGRFFEINSNGTIVWDYNLPIDHNSGLPFPENSPNGTSSFTFRALKYDLDYPAFENKTIIPGQPLENNPNITPCLQILGEDEFDIAQKINIYPNPTSNSVTINSDVTIDQIEIYSTSGKRILKRTSFSENIDLEEFKNGIYFLKLALRDKVVIKKIIKI